MSLKTIFLVFLLLSNKLYSQVNSYKLIDFNKNSEAANQIIRHNDNFLISYSQFCSEQGLIVPCSGILMLNPNFDIVDNSFHVSFSDNPNSILIDTIQNKLFYSGEIFNDQSYFAVLVKSLSNLELLDSILLKPNIKIDNLFQITSSKFGNKLVISGDGTIQNENQNYDSAILFFANNDNSVDTIMYFGNKGSNTNPWAQYIDKNENLTIHLSIKWFSGSPSYQSKIIKLNKDLQIVWSWTSEKLKYLQLPFGCESDGNSIVALADDGSTKIAKVVSINTDSTIKWEFVFKEKKSQLRQINRLKKLKNEDIIAVGMYGNLNLDNPKISELPYIFCLSKDGELKWQRAFYYNNYLPNGKVTNGYLKDVVELENGNLIAVGKIDTYKISDSDTTKKFLQSDILLLNLNSNGCLKDNCDELIKLDTIISYTTDLSSPLKYIYPNPNNGILKINNSSEIEKILVRNELGLLIKEFKDFGNEIELINFQKGLYFVTIIFKNQLKVIEKIAIY